MVVILVETFLCPKAHRENWIGALPSGSDTWSGVSEFGFAKSVCFAWNEASSAVVKQLVLE